MRSLLFVLLSVFLFEHLSQARRSGGDELKPVELFPPESVITTAIKKFICAQMLWFSEKAAPPVVGITGTEANVGNGERSCPAKMRNIIKTSSTRKAECRDCSSAMSFVSAVASKPICSVDSSIRIEPTKLLINNTFLLEDEEWRRNAIEKMWEERDNMPHTPIKKFSPSGYPNTDILFKNETASPTRTLKYRFAWSLIMWAILERKIGRNTTVYDSTAGNAGASEAYMCNLVGLPYVAVIPNELEVEKVRQITDNGGKIIKVDVTLCDIHAQEQADKTGGYYINQIANAGRADEYHERQNYTRPSINVFHEILAELNVDISKKKKIPDYFVHNSGTGGTISSVGRYIARHRLPTRVVLSDAEFSVFHDYVISNTTCVANFTKPGVAGIGYYNAEPIVYGETCSLARTVVHESMKMPDIASAAAMKVLRRRGINGGASTALNFLVSLAKAYEHRNGKDRLTIATLICDPSDFYDSTYFNSTWLDETFGSRGGLAALKCWEEIIDNAIDNGGDFLSDGLWKCTAQKTCDT